MLGKVFLIAVAVVLFGCKVEQLGSGSVCSPLGPCVGSTNNPNPNPDPNPNPAPGTGTPSQDRYTLGSPFLLSLKSYWYEDTTESFPTDLSLKRIKGAGGVYLNTGTASDLDTTDCKISSSVTLASSASERNVICGVSVPETQLYYSALKFQIQLPSEHDCDVVNFFPYFYRVSSSNPFTSWWSPSNTDCSVLTAGVYPTACYSGPATHLVPGFPNNTWLVHIPTGGTSSATSFTWKANAAFPSRRTDNRWTAYRNDSPAGIPGFAVGATQDWTFQCQKSGSNLQYSYIVRILPVKDSPFTDGGPRAQGWLEDDGVTSRASVGY